MKNILITGENSYVGNSLAKYLEKWPNDYKIDKISSRNDDWKNKNFSEYDTIYHVSGIVHIKETKENRELYYKVNRDLTFELAKRAKSSGVKQFIFLSTMSVYGFTQGIITKETIPNPKNSYGKSKLEAESLIANLHEENFKVVILRPPMIYGKGCKGNYEKLSKFAKITPIFPLIENKRSMLYIDNLSYFVKNIIDEGKSGVYLPQNKEYVCTSQMVELIAKCNNKKIKLIDVFNPFIKTLNMDILNKVFGSLIYDKVDLIQKIEFNESIINTEK